MKEVLWARDEDKVNLLRDDFEVLSKLANPDNHKRGIPSIQKMNMERLEDYRELEHKYGRNTAMKVSPGNKGSGSNYKRLDYLQIRNTFDSTMGRSKSVVHHNGMNRH
jgi:hypothetical protein